MSTPTKSPPRDTTLPTGDRNQNPVDLGLWALLQEDFETYRRDPLSPGFWAVAVHRLGNWRMDVKSKLARAPLTAAYRVAFHAVVAAWGIDLPYNVKLGRRVRIEHHGCLMLGARQIGDDVVIRHSVTMGLRQRGAAAFPTIGDRVEIGPGACIVGGVTIGHDAYIGANTVIAYNVRPGAALIGIPPKPLEVALAGETLQPSSKSAA
jgi:serine O-acetyltransferase